MQRDDKKKKSSLGSDLIKKQRQAQDARAEEKEKQKEQSSFTKSTNAKDTTRGFTNRADGRGEATFGSYAKGRHQTLLNKGRPTLPQITEEEPSTTRKPTGGKG